MKSLAAIVGIVLQLSSANSAEISVKGSLPDGGQIFLLSGSITKGDAQKLAGAGLTFGSVLSLRSDGGDFREGMALARFIFENRIGTIVEDGARCLSACAIAFLGGATDGEVEGIVVPSRSIAPSGKLGFHAPFLNVSDGMHNNDEIEIAYDRAVATVVDFVQMDRSLQITPGDAAELMRPQRLKLKYLDTAGLLGRYNVAVQGLDAMPHITPTMAISLCSNGWNWADNYKFNATVEDNVDVYKEALALASKLKWKAKASTFDDSGTGRTKVTMVPIATGMEGTILFCKVAHVYTELGNLISCEGFYNAESLQQAISYAKEGYEPDFECKDPIIVDPLLGYDVSSQEASRKLAPPDTPLSEIKPTLEALYRGEEHIPAP